MQVLYDLGVVSTKEPFGRLVSQVGLPHFSYERSDCIIPLVL